MSILLLANNLQSPICDLEKRRKKKMILINKGILVVAQYKQYDLTQNNAPEFSF